MDEKYYVEMFDTNEMITIEEWEFDTEEEARGFFESRKDDYCMTDSDRRHTEWILSTHDSYGEYVQIDNFIMADTL